MNFEKKISAQYSSELYEADVLRKAQVYAFLGDSVSSEVNCKCLDLANFLNNRIESMDEECCLPVIDVILNQHDNEYSVSFEGLLGVAVNNPETRFRDRYFWYEFKMSSDVMSESDMSSTLTDIKNEIIERIKECESDGDFKCEDPSDYLSVLVFAIGSTINSYFQLNHRISQTFEKPALYNDDIFENSIFMAYDPTSEYCNSSGNYEHFHNKKIREFFGSYDWEEVPLKRYYLVPFVLVENVSNFPDRKTIIKKAIHNEASAVIETCFINNDYCRLQVSHDPFYTEKHDVVISGVLFVQKEYQDLTDNEKNLTAKEDSEMIEKLNEFFKNDVNQYVK